MTTIRDLLKEGPCRFQLGPLIRFLGQLEGVADPLAGGDLDRAVVRLRNRRDPRPPVADVDSLKRGANGGWDVYTGLLGLLGPGGALDYNAQAALTDAPGMLDAVDRVIHRLLSVWYEAWLTGTRGPEVTTSHPAFRSPSGLALWVERAIGIPTRIIPLAGEWTEAADTHHLQFTRQRRSRIELGPLGRAEYLSLLPGEAGFRRLFAVLDAHTEGVEWQVALIMRPGEAPLSSWDLPGCRFNISATFEADDRGRNSATAVFVFDARSGVFQGGRDGQHP